MKKEKSIFDSIIYVDNTATSKKADTNIKKSRTNKEVGY